MSRPYYHAELTFSLEIRSPETLTATQVVDIAKQAIYRPASDIGVMGLSEYPVTVVVTDVVVEVV